MTDTTISAIDEAPTERQPAAPFMALVHTIESLLAISLTSYFVLAACTLYWLSAAGAWVSARLLPTRLIERCALPLLALAACAIAALTQLIPGFFPDYSRKEDIAAELALWLAVGLFARAYFAYTDLPATFEGLQTAIAERRFDKWLAARLLRPIDAIFTRTWVSTSVAVLPLATLLFIPSTTNYLVVAAYSALVLLVQFPYELMDHTNHHNRIFAPRSDASPATRRLLAVLDKYTSWVLCLALTRVPEYHRIQHVYVHHVAGNGHDDTQTTLPYDRLSFFDFARHAFRQGLDLVTGLWTFRYLLAKGKTRQARQLLVGFATWWAFAALLTLINPVAGFFYVLCRFVGGNILSIFAYYQHGLVDHDDVDDVHGNTTNFDGSEHGNLGNDFHVEHHLRPGRHWSQYYLDFARASAAPQGYQAVVAENTDAFGPLAFVAALWSRDFPRIARHVRVPGGASADAATIEALVTERTRPYGRPARDGLPARLDDLAGRLMARALPTAFRI